MILVADASANTAGKSPWKHPFFRKNPWQRSQIDLLLTAGDFVEICHDDKTEIHK